MHGVESLNQYLLAFRVERYKVQLRMVSFDFFSNFLKNISDVLNFILPLLIMTENSLHIF